MACQIEKEWSTDMNGAQRCRVAAVSSAGQDYSLLPLLPSRSSIIEALWEGQKANNEQYNQPVATPVNPTDSTDSRVPVFLTSSTDLYSHESTAHSTTSAPHTNPVVSSTIRNQPHRRLHLFRRTVPCA